MPAPLRPREVNRPSIPWTDAVTCHPIRPQEGHYPPLPVRGGMASAPVVMDGGIDGVPPRGKGGDNAPLMGDGGHNTLSTGLGPSYFGLKLMGRGGYFKAVSGRLLFS